MSWVLRHLRALVVVAVAAVVLFGAGAVLGGRAPSHVDGTASAGTPAAPDRLATAIARAQERLRLVPGDYVTWAALGSAYLERARVTADPAYYPKAEGALRRSLELRPADNTGALTGLGALANARHDFAAARTLAQQALRDNPYHADAFGVLADAQTQLGNAAAATEAVQHMLDLRPGLPALARASYDLEQHGRIAEAQVLLRKALTDAVDPADVGFCRYQLGELAWHSGQLAEAGEQYTAGASADPAYLALTQGRAKVAFAQGRVDEALAGYAELTSRSPTPGYLIEYAELLSAAGRSGEADSQLDLAEAAVRLFAANGGADDLAGAALALARSQPAEAVRLASREWQRRQFADVADVLGWALHQAGRDAEALPLARRAGALGARNAAYTYHLAAIELALGDQAAARRDLTQALSINPYFSPLDAPIAARTLAGLERPPADAAQRSPRSSGRNWGAES
jgi:tetratricopeptide (TPR) repeat protein